MGLVSIDVSDLKFYDDWKAAPKGAVLRVFPSTHVANIASNAVVFGLRCQQTSPDARDAVLILSGPAAGTILGNLHLRKEAFDVTALVTMTVPVEAKLHQEETPRCVVQVQFPDGVTIAVRAEGPDGFQGWVHLGGCRDAGEWLTKVPHRSVIGERIALRLKDDHARSRDDVFL